MADRQRLTGVVLPQTLRPVMRDLAPLPKAHLHIHLDGAMRPSTLRELAEAMGIAAPMPTAYGSFAAFMATITAAGQTLQTEQNLRRVVREIMEDSAAQGAVWVEPSMWPGMLGGRLGSDAEAVDIVLEAGRAAANEYGIGFGLIIAANRNRGPDEAVALADLAASRARHGVVGFGLDGDEANHPPGPFADAFQIARKAALLALPHAGELAGPDSVVAALDLLGADRILHGVRAVEDAEVVARLAERGTCLDVCPTSNVKLSVVNSLEDHPLPALLAAGVRCSLNADDPLLFATDLVDEYRLVRDRLHLTDAQLAGLACTSLEASAAPRDLIRDTVQKIELWLSTDTAEAAETPAPSD